MLCFIAMDTIEMILVTICARVNCFHATFFAYQSHATLHDDRTIATLAQCIRTYSAPFFVIVIVFPGVGCARRHVTLPRGGHDCLNTK